MTVIVNCGLGNLGSILNMFRKIGVVAEIAESPAAIKRADRVVLPGVGAFDHGMESLEGRGFVPALQAAAMERGVPTLGICLGAQLMTRRSEEGDRPGLGWIAADTVRFFSRHAVNGLKVPHMGWSDVAVKKPNPLLDSHAEQRFYFVHSYHFQCDDPADVLAEAEYGYRFPAAFSRGNLFGVQFHPEKSHRFGMELLRRFAAL